MSRGSCSDTEEVTGSIPVPLTMFSQVRGQSPGPRGLAFLIICPWFVRGVRRHLASPGSAKRQKFTQPTGLASTSSGGRGTTVCRQLESSQHW